MVWRFVPPPWNQLKPMTLPKGVVPAGAINTQSNVPSETIQMVGQPGTGSKVPMRASIDLGVADVYISDSGRKIEFSGKGLQTDVGARIPSTTKGMSIPGRKRVKYTVSGKASSRKIANRGRMVITGITGMKPGTVKELTGI